MAPRKKSNRKEIYDIATGNRIELPEDDRRSEMAAAILTGNGLAIEEDPEVEKELNGGFMDAIGPHRNDPHFLSDADGLSAALRDTNKEIEVATPYGNFPVDFVMNSIYADVMRSPSPTELLKCCLRELMLIRMGRAR